MDEQQRKALLKETFNTVSGGYDGKALRFFPDSAKHMASLLGLRGDEQVLDVACGTGNAALAIAPLLPHGKVTAVDFSPGMLEQARGKAASLDIGNIEFLERDMQDLRFPGRQFDVATCAFGIFFVEDMENQLRHIASTVKPGGRVMTTSFCENYFSPMKELFFERIAAYKVLNPLQPWKRVAHEAGCGRLFESDGMTDTRVETRNVGYYLDTADQWWSIVWNAGMRRMVTQLPPDDQERFREEHLREVEQLKTKKGIRLDVDVLYTIGTKA